MNNSNIFPGWEIVEPIGSGGFSKVYKIRKTDSSRTDFLSALKVIEIPHSPDEYQSYRADGYDDNSITQIFDDQVKEIIQEFELMHQFRGVTNIVSYEDHLVIQNDNGIGWKILIRMELLQTLPDWYMCHSMKDSDVKQLGIDICRALKLCEQKNIVHRDIKPQNIFANAFDDFKLGDFGVARVMEHTTRATKIGTYSYMAPEVYNGKPYNYISDIYSLGMVLYWLLNERRLPFLPLPPAVPTPTMNNEAQMRRINGEPIPAPKYGSDELKAVVLKACAYDPKDRYASAEEFMQALQSAKCGGIVCNPTVTDTVDRAEHTATEIVTSPKIDDDVTVSIFHSGVPFDAEQPVAEDGTEAPSNASVLFGESVNTANSDDEKTVSMFFDNAVTAKPHREAPPESETPKQEKPIIEEPKKAPEEAPEKVTEEAPVASEANESEGETVKKRKLWVWLLLLGAVIAAVIVIAMSCGHEHSPNGRIKSYNSSYHWDECECGEILNKSEHVCDGWHIGVEPTETSEGTKARYCKDCPFIETEAIPPVGEGGDNSNDSDVSSDISTDVSMDVSTDTSTDVSIDTSTDVSTDISQDVSDTSSDVSVDTSADVSTDVSQEPDSSVVPDVSETHTHSYSSGWKSNETSHWKVCDCGEKSYTDAHKFSSWTTTKKATETTTGSKERTCKTCGYKETAKIPVLSHKHSYSSSWKSNETSHWTVCDCGEKNSLASHTYGAWKTTKSATCTTAGSKTRTCTVCGYKETATISATGSHTYGSWTTTKSATCVATGSKKRTCSVCGKAETQTIAATGSHTYGDWTITLFPTCVDSGKEQRTCSVCGNAETISIPPTGHSYSNGSCVDCGKIKLSYGLSYTWNGSGYTVSRGTCSDTKIGIAKYYNDYPVTAIADNAFLGYSDLTSVSIPDSVITIGDGAFRECAGLTSVSIPDSVTEIGAEAFSHCTGLLSITIPDSVTEIGMRAFYWCYSLTSVTMPNYLTTIKSSTFESCSSLKTIVIPNSLTIIEQDAFYACYKLEDLVLPSSLYKIGSRAFAYCTNFYGTVIPRSVTQIGSRIFDGCEYIALLGCEATSKPSGWADDWLDGCPADVYWGW